MELVTEEQGGGAEVQGSCADSTCYQFSVRKLHHDLSCGLLTFCLGLNESRVLVPIVTSCWQGQRARSENNLERNIQQNASVDAD